MADWSKRTIAGLDAARAAPWLVMAAQSTPPMPVCGEYQSAASAHRALELAGFAPSAAFAAAPEEMAACDRQTVLRYARDGDQVLLAQRLPGS